MEGVEAAMAAMIRPTWADPRYLLATNSFRVSTPSLVGSVATVAAPNDPRRWAVGFLIPTGFPTTFSLSPASDPTTGAWILNSNTSALWFNIFTHGGIVCADWRVIASGNSTIKVFEVYVN